MNRVVFLDRDGVVNKVILKGGKPFSPRRLEQFRLLDGIIEALKKLREEGFLNIVVTNQPDITRGMIKWEELNRIHKLVKEKLPIDDIMVCPHDDKNNCPCRKPQPGMLLEAAKKWGIDLRRSFLIGDQWKDIRAGKNAGCTTILIDYPYNQWATPDFRVNEMQSAVQIILNSKRNK